MHWDYARKVVCTLYYGHKVGSATLYLTRGGRRDVTIQMNESADDRCVLHLHLPRFQTNAGNPASNLPPCTMANELTEAKFFDLNVVT